MHYFIAMTQRDDNHINLSRPSGFSVYDMENLSLACWSLANSVDDDILLQ